MRGPEAPLGRVNIRVAWWMIGASMAVGAVLGLWSFGGPLAPPPGFRAFDDLPRRLVRLGHIAGVALPALNLLYVPWMARSRWGRATRRTGCGSSSSAHSRFRVSSGWRRSGVPGSTCCPFPCWR